MSLLIAVPFFFKQYYYKTVAPLDGPPVFGRPPPGYLIVHKLLLHFSNDLGPILFIILAHSSVK